MDTGWTAGQTGASAYDNYIKYWTYKWCEYINAGAWDGNLSISGNLTVTGTTAISGLATIGGTLAVTGATTVGGALTSSGIVTGTSLRHTAVKTLLIPAALACEYPGSHNYDWVNLRRTIGTSVGQIHYPIQLEAGQRIKVWRLYVKHGSATGTITAKMLKLQMTGGGPTVSTIGTVYTYTGPDVSWFYMSSPTSIDEPVTNEASYVVEFVGCGTTGDFTYHLEVDVTCP